MRRFPLEALGWCRSWAGEGAALRPGGAPSDESTGNDVPESEGAAIPVRIKRAYEPAEPTDGYRILVDRLWPRGVSKGEARLDEWAKELAPSPELRRWFGHDPERFEEFRLRYHDELTALEDELDELRRRARRGPVTLVYGAHDTEHNGAVVLAELLATSGAAGS